MMIQDQEKRKISQTGLEIAVIGMAGRFPGAQNIMEFWNNIKEGKESIAFYNDDELAEGGVPKELFADHNYVKSAGGIIAGFESFDSDFFDYTPREADVMDPQLRLFHEYAWHALEDAGYDPYVYPGSIGLYGGASFNLDWQALTILSGKCNISDFASHLLVNKDFLCSRVSYKLNLKGPSVLVQTACSTSLVAIHLACRALLTKECDMALAGGISIGALKNRGYMFQENMIMSPDGHCRAFDERAAGTIMGQGIGIVVLKKLKNAIDDGDHIYAVVKGSAVNNDGNNKVGYTAPAVTGQIDVIKTALYISQVDPESIGYIEAHGTGTGLGDPIEMKALKEAFNSKKRYFCAVGSIKTNIGHLDAAAGAASFIKTVLVLKHKLIPPSLHFDKQNPKCIMEDSPFYINNKLTEWTNAGSPLRAGVSSFGIGGTNAHVVLEEWPENDSTHAGRNEDRGAPACESDNKEQAAQNEEQSGYQLFLLSAKTETALDRMTENFVTFLKNNPAVNPADAAYTLQIGRRSFRHRRFLISRSIDETIDYLSSLKNTASPVSRRVKTHTSDGKNKFIVFMFPGIGPQYVNMGLALYQTKPLFREEMDRCFEILKPLVEYDLRGLLYPGLYPVTRSSDSSAKQTLSETDINHTQTAPLVLFIFEYALAKLLMNWGVKPNAMIGYSFGEYSAACISGVFSLEKALELIVIRSKLIEKSPAGAMLSVPLPQVELTPILAEFNLQYSTVGKVDNPACLPVSLAIDNGTSCIAAGPVEMIDIFERYLNKKRYICMRVPAARALHSPMMEPILAGYAEKLVKISLDKPQIPYISNVTGYWMSASDAVDPGYWVKHLKQTVRFADGIRELVKEPDCIFIEVGPGHDLSSLISRWLEKNPAQKTLSLIKAQEREDKDITDDYYLLSRLGQLWLYGGEIDWLSFNPGRSRRRLSLPTYPFELRRYMIERDEIKSKKKNKPVNAIHSKTDISDWFYIPSWKRIRPVDHNRNKTTTPLRWLVFIDENGVGQEICGELKKEGHEIITVKNSARAQNPFQADFIIDPVEENDYHELFAKLQVAGKIPQRIVHLWCITGRESGCMEPGTVMKAQHTGFFSLVNIAKAIGREAINSEIQICVLTDNMQDVGGEAELHPWKATVLGPLLVIPLEFPNIKCRSIDVEWLLQAGQSNRKLIRQLAAELMSDSFEPIIVYRDNNRWQQILEPSPIKETTGVPPLLRKNGVYVITGGLGGIGLHLARYLAQQVQARLVLLGRTPLPDRDKWTECLNNSERENNISHKIRKIQELEALGAEVLIFTADVADRVGMEEVIIRIKERYGCINGVIHAAGIADGALIQLRTTETSERIFESKIKGTLILDSLLEGEELDFFIICSALASFLGAVGQVGYVAANNFLDAFARYKRLKSDRLTISIDWDRWRNVGIATIAERIHRNLRGDDLGGGITAEQGIEVFDRILNENFPQILVSTYDLAVLQDFNKYMKISLLVDEVAGTGASRTLFPRPELLTEYIAPRNINEQKLVETWQSIFGYEQIGVKDDFFELGGDSLKAIQAIAKINKELEVNIAITEFFNNPTIEKIAGLIGNKYKSSYIPIKAEEKKEYHALSSAQKRLYILHRLDPQGTSYNSFEILYLPIDMINDKLENTLTELVRRHENLRTSFAMIDGTPVQRIHDRIDCEILFNELKGESEVVRIARDSLKPFDLSKAPLFRFYVFKLPNNRYIGLIELHHIIADGMSYNILTRDFLTIYSGRELPVMRLQYRDFAEWQSSRQQQESMKLQQSYWIERFSDKLPVLNLPTDYPRPLQQSFAGAIVGFALDRQETQLMKQIAQELDITYYMVVLSLFNILLAKLSGQEDIIVGTPTAGRRHADLEDMVGMLVNTLPVRNYPYVEKSCREFLLDVKRNTLFAYENQDFQFEHLVERIALKRDISRNPIFDVMLNMMSQVDYKGNKSTPGERGSIGHISAASMFDLTLTVMESGEEFYFNFEYCTALFTPSTIDRFIDYFKRIASGISKNLDQKLGYIEILSTDEKTQLLHDFNDSAGEYPSEKTIQQLIDEQVQRTPDKIALAYESMAVTFIELNVRADRLAGYLGKKGVVPRTIIGILLDRSMEVLTAIYGILKAGGVYLPLDPNHPEKRLKYILQESRAGFVITDSYRSFEQGEFGLIDINNNEIYRSRNTGSFPVISASDPVYVTYTSGSTGNPKGVMIRHRNVVNFIAGIRNEIAFSEDDILLSLTTISFDIFGLETLLPLTTGTKVIIGSKAEQMDGYLISASLRRNKVTIMQVTPSRLKYLLGDSETAESLSLLKKLLIGGEELPVELLNSVTAVAAGRIFNLYGPTETTIWSTLKDISRDKFVTIGRPILNTQVYILDKTYMLQPPGVVGEIYIGGTGLAQGYLNNVELTDERFSDDPFKPSGKIYKTGDLGRWLPSGNIECLGRMDYQVKIRGFRVELGEIERRILEIDFVAEALLVEQADATGDKYLCAYIVLKDDKKKRKVEKETGEHELVRDNTEIRNAIRSYLAGFLPDYMIPAYFVKLDKIPLTPNGKIDRKSLPGPQVSIGKDYTAPRDEIEEKLVQIWAEVLGLQKEAIGIDDNFFEIGGNSLKLINVERKIEDKLHKEIPVIDLFTYSTIRLIGDYLLEGKKTLVLPEEDRAEKIRTGKDKLKEKRRRRAAEVVI